MRKIGDGDTLGLTKREPEAVSHALEVTTPARLLALRRGEVHIRRMSQHSIGEARDQLPDLIDHARAGEGLVILHDGHPMVELCPLEPSVALPTHPARAARLDWLASREEPDPLLLAARAVEQDELLAAELADWDATVGDGVYGTGAS